MIRSSRAEVAAGGLTVAEEKTVYRAMRVLEKAMQREEVPVFTSPSLTRVYLRMRMGTLEREEFQDPNISAMWRELGKLASGSDVMVPRDGIEPPTRGFSILCSTD